MGAVPAGTPAPPGTPHRAEDLGTRLWAAFLEHRLLLLRGRGDSVRECVSLLLEALAAESGAAQREWTVERRGGAEGDSGGGVLGDVGDADVTLRALSGARLQATQSRACGQRVSRAGAWVRAVPRRDGTARRLGSAGGAAEQHAVQVDACVPFYVSCVLNGGAARRVAAAAGGIPSPLADAAKRGEVDVAHSVPLWWFCGANEPREETQAGARKRRREGEDVAQWPPLLGRKEHTDKVAQSGTWHLQVAGRKRWTLHPAPATAWEDLGRAPPRLPVPEEGSDAGRLVIECCAGDILVIDTRRWVHATALPAARGLSMSYARDFFLSEDYGGVGAARAAAREADGFTNVAGGTLALEEESVETGGVLLQEGDELADGVEVGMSRDPNAEYVSLCDGDTEVTALVALRRIPRGDFVTVAPDSDDEFDSGEECIC